MLYALHSLPFSVPEWAMMLAAIAVAYIVFGIAGFGTALVAGPILIHTMSLSRVIPLLVLLDFVAAFGNLLPSRQAVVGGELFRLLPFMAIGCTLAVVFLLKLQSNALRCCYRQRGHQCTSAFANMPIECNWESNIAKTAITFGNHGSSMGPFAALNRLAVARNANPTKSHGEKPFQNRSAAGCGIASPNNPFHDTSVEQ
jgi:hypothetical protein